MIEYMPLSAKSSAICQQNQKLFFMLPRDQVFLLPQSEKKNLLSSSVFTKIPSSETSDPAGLWLLKFVRQIHIRQNLWHNYLSVFHGWKCWNLKFVRYMAELSTQKVKLANLKNLEVIKYWAGSDDGIFVKTLKHYSYMIEKIRQIDIGI